ncbi:putative Defensin-like protein [Hibiscus syriacus]|uniref:Defensin-like protein n=1 Tax=Hibiscus syriacus TaxID=106335 RepID=A0A6A2XC36_HIBSY|nr:uncharacterized protein LOC120171448 [Hibiscus syriacus]KAE8672852.1 putative Defensin-like protein [Hibiscus syriacus]
MDAFDIKLEKRNAMSKQHQLCKVANLLRFVEVCVLLVLISRFTTHLPVAFGKYFRGLSVLLVSPRFVFVVGNVIVITLFAKAGQFSASRTDLYEEFVEAREKNHSVHRYETERKSVPSGEEKRIISLNVNTPKGTKSMRRTKSENLKRKSDHKQHCNQLQRLGSEKYVKHGDPEEEPAKSSCPEDGMSNEQFRNTIEAFIARQKKLLREEEYSVIYKDLE